MSGNLLSLRPEKIVLNQIRNERKPDMDLSHREDKLNIRNLKCQSQIQSHNLLEYNDFSPWLP